MNLSLLPELIAQFTKKDDVYEFLCIRERNPITMSYCEEKCHYVAYCAECDEARVGLEKMLLLMEFDSFIKLRMNNISDISKQIQQYRELGDIEQERYKVAKMNKIISKYAIEIAQKEEELDYKWEQIWSSLLPF